MYQLQLKLYLLQLNKLNDIPTKSKIKIPFEFLKPKTQGYIHSTQQLAQTEMT